MTAASQAERDELRASVRTFLAGHCGEPAVRRAADSDLGYDDGLWGQMAEQQGLVGLSLPTEFGGDGFGCGELAVVLEELGRVLAPSPFFGTVVLAATALRASGDDAAQAQYLPKIAAGAMTATVALVEADGLWTGTPLATTARREGSNWVLDGAKQFVIDGATADLVLVTAATDDGPALFAVTDGFARRPMRTLDLTRRLATLSFAATPATRVGAPGDSSRIVDAVLAWASAALAAEQVGAATACVEASTGYARDRMQFGRPIGSFQAVKHKCAEMFARTQLAAAAAVEAAAALDRVEGAPPVPLATAVAHAVCSEAFMFVAAENIQVHGGIGFTWEHPAHLYFRRAKSSQLLLGGPAVYYERLLSAALA
jgi:alkylation response protein AidB-like acyl-CoA dehydrogenase